MLKHTTIAGRGEAEHSARREDKALAFIMNLVYERSRIHLHDGKEALIRTRLGKRLRHHGFHCLADYTEYLQATADEEEITHLVDAITTNFTSFLREPDHFRFLVESALPALGVRERRRIRVWSAACATGEEPYSIAFHLEESYPSLQGYDWRILATDISTRVLAKAQQGIYGLDRIATLPKAWLHRFWQKGIGQADGLFRVKPELAERVQFQQMNLLSGCDPGQQFEVIFCRNVLIYFDRPTQEQLIKTLCRFLVPKGYVLIGHSESLNGLAVPVRCLRPSYYQKE